MVPSSSSTNAPAPSCSRMTWLMTLILLQALAACTPLPPKNSGNICATFTEKDGWYDDARRSSEKWGIPIPVQMAIMYQESRFVADAEPARPWLLGFIPWFKASTAYGYAQAKDETWDNYLDQAGGWSADRDDFADAADFIGWYCNISYSKLGIAKWDARNLYLAYHEGHGGYKRKSYLQKPWLLQIANKVAKQASLFQKQLNACNAN